MGSILEHPHLTDQDRALLLAFRDKARCDLSTLDLSSQLIHADLLQENILVDGSQVFIIDFDDCVYGYLAFDMATPLVQRVSDSNFRDLRDAMFEGYGGVDTGVLALLFAARCLTYVGWIMDKMVTKEGQAMSKRIVTRALDQTRKFLNGKSPMLT